MQVYQIYTESSLRNFTYVLAYNENKAICIDPYHGSKVAKFLQKNSLELSMIINTHEHLDHYCGNDELINFTRCEKVVCHKKAASIIPGVSDTLESGDKIDLGDGKFLQVLDTPGHTFAHLCLLLIDSKRPQAIFTGDTLFNAGVGNCHGGGSPEVLYETISTIFSDIPDNVIVYPGHDYLSNNLKFTLDRWPSNKVASQMLVKCEQEIRPANELINSFQVTTMGEERKINTFLCLDVKEIKQGLVEKFDSIADIDQLNDRQTFVNLRKLRDQW